MTASLVIEDVYRRSLAASMSLTMVATQAIIPTIADDALIAEGTADSFEAAKAAALYEAETALRKP
jgi:hypothetical protein